MGVCLLPAGGLMVSALSSASLNAHADGWRGVRHDVGCLHRWQAVSSGGWCPLPLIVCGKLPISASGRKPAYLKNQRGRKPPSFFWFFSLLIPHVRVHDTHTTPLGWVAQRVVCVMHGL